MGLKAGWFMDLCSFCFGIFSRIVWISLRIEQGFNEDFFDKNGGVIAVK